MRVEGEEIRIRSGSRPHGDAPFVLGVLLGALLATVLYPAAAFASPPESCVNVRFNTQGTDSAQFGNHVGIKANVWFGHWNSLLNGGDCDRVTSIGVINGTGVVEYGAVLGWLPSGGNVYTGADRCNDHYFKTPEVFQVWQPIGGNYHCREVGAAAANNYYTLSVTDANQDTVWHALTGSTDHGSMNVNFSRGVVATNGERHNQSLDTAFAHFQLLKKQVAGTSTWSNFTSSYQGCCFPPDPHFDPGFHWFFISNTETEVLRN